MSPTYPPPPGPSASFIVACITLGVLSLGSLLGGAMYGCPRYNVYERRLAGQAELSQAEANRRIRTLEAEATFESSRHLAAAEIERAKGVAEANKIIGDSLRNNEDYLRYLWIHNLEVSEGKGNTVIYVPTEANLPILEATRGVK